jgi:hypothetical protein
MPHDAHDRRLPGSECVGRGQGRDREAAGAGQGREGPSRHAEGQVATLTTVKGKLDGEIVGLKSNSRTRRPRHAQSGRRTRAAVVNKAIAVSPNIVTDGKSDAEIRKEVVNAAVRRRRQGLRRRQDRGRFDRADQGLAPGIRSASTLKDGLRTNTNDNGASVRDLARAAQF